MKRFEHVWNNEFFLLHIQLNNTDTSFDSIVTRKYEGGEYKTEVESVRKNEKSHRFIVSRTHPKETSILIDYPENVILEAFKIDDRAYYPTEPFFVG
jgi:hypothetical protein